MTQLPAPADAEADHAATRRAAAPEPVIELRDVSMSFAKLSGEPLPVLGHVGLTLREGEILGLLGRSGSGKSTLLRIAAGLVAPTSGQVIYRGAPLRGPAEGIAVVFQTFALYPWLSVADNVALGLDAIDLPHDQVAPRVREAIDLIGLDGFQSAYPRELSGGMRQRVGFARALAAEPALLLMDEPFSALDVLTADTLRTDFLDLWHAHQLSIKAVMMVTHNIEEAVLMCDRVLVLGAHPGHVVADVRIPLAYPRNRLDGAFQALANEIYSVLTTRIVESIAMRDSTHNGFAQRLPNVSAYRIDGFVDALAANAGDGDAEFARLAASLTMKMDEMLPVATALHLLEFGELHDGSIRLTAAGRAYARSGPPARKRIFREHLEHFVPLVAHIREVLDERDAHVAPRERFELELQDHLNPSDADRALLTAIDWGRFSGLYTYDDRARVFRRGDDNDDDDA
ncbi:Taurine-transporting ATPase [Burkholderia sp. lig30]|jgi:NitT/TauT family transport system ATP-binding protein|nr:Taurine-transporting ATPase [Burkholderia sp. lig30]